MACLAQARFFKKEFVVRPNIRSGRLYGTPTCRKPTQVRSPRRKRLVSGRLLRASTTRRSSSEKSPASSGIGT